MNIMIRSADLPHDYVAIAAVLASESPDWAETAEGLAYEDARRDPRYHHAVFVAEVEAGAEPFMVGVAFVGHDELAYRPDKFELNLRVREDWQGRGVGKALYQATMAHLASLNPAEVHANVWHAHPRTARFLLERGFVEVWRRLDSSLDVAGFDLTPYEGLADKLRERGIEIKTYVDLADDPDRLEKLYELDWALWQDVPYGQAVSKRTLAQFVAQEIDHPKFIPDACFIAVKAADYIGYSNLSQEGGGFNTELTGVLAAYRGQGIATALKLAGIRYAQAHGNLRLFVQNDAVNKAMLGLNDKLGYVRDGAMVRFVKFMGKSGQL
jgi:GNAT superfamily N-acetyltransferase